MRLRYHFEYAGARLLVFLAGRLSPRQGAWLGKRLGDAACAVLSRRRKLVQTHLARVFGEDPAQDTPEALTRSVFRQLGCTAVEHARLMGSGVTDPGSRIVFSGSEHVTEALQQGNGAILVTGHFGYWELLGASVASLGFPIAVIAKDQHNPAVNRMINLWRERMGMRVIPMASATHQILRMLRKNGVVGFLVDQDAGPGGTFVTFLGLPAATYQGPALFALRVRAPIIPCFIVREDVEQHRVIFNPPIYALPTGDEAADIQRYTQLYTAALERCVRTWPDHWFWVHRRWKTKAIENEAIPQ